jgi:homoserine kinase
MGKGHVPPISDVMTQSPPSQGREIAVSGSISNLGPAFDALSVAVDVDLRLRIVDVRPTEPGLLDMDFGGRGPTGENRIATGFLAAQQRFGQAAPGVRVEVASEIPMKAGLGSSAAATVAGLRLYEAVTAPRDADALMEIATGIEGHPDNAAAALFGGLTLSCERDDGGVLTSSWRWPDQLRFVVATPEAELETKFARQVLSPSIDRRDAVFNLQRALLLVRALETGRYDHLREALRDRWHQPARARYVPGLADALALDHPSVLGVCLSGAGPSIAAVAAAGRQDEASEQLRRIYDRIGVPCTIRTLSARAPVDAHASSSEARSVPKPTIGSEPREIRTPS